MRKLVVAILVSLLTISFASAESVSDTIRNAVKDKEVVGKGAFTNPNQVMARNMALNIALNDLAKSVGEVLVEEDTQLLNDQVRMLIRTRARNVIAGYEVVEDTYDADTGEAVVHVRQNGDVLATNIGSLLENADEI